MRKNRFTWACSHVMSIFVELMGEFSWQNWDTQQAWLNFTITFPLGVVISERLFLKLFQIDYNFFNNSFDSVDFQVSREQVLVLGVFRVNELHDYWYPCKWSESSQSLLDPFGAYRVKRLEKSRYDNLLLGLCLKLSVFLYVLVMDRDGCGDRVR